MLMSVSHVTTEQTTHPVLALMNLAVHALPSFDESAKLSPSLLS